VGRSLVRAFGEGKTYERRLITTRSAGARSDGLDYDPLRQKTVRLVRGSETVPVTS
jgi:hypothetical protein